MEHKMRNQTVIRTLIREMLNESDRFSREMGRDFNTFKDRRMDIEKMSKQKITKKVPLYYFNMSSDFTKTSNRGSSQKNQPMAFQNPGEEYNSTPYGYYAYPLTKDYLERFKETNLPYINESDYITIIKAKSSDHLLFLGNPTDASLYEQVKSYTENDPRQSVKMTSVFLGNALLEDEGLNEEIASRAIDWIYDPGKKLIHPHEPTQVVFLKTNAFEVVDRFSARQAFEAVAGPAERFVGDRIATSHGDEKIPFNRKYLDDIEKAKTTSDKKTIEYLSKHPRNDVRRALLLNPNVSPAGALKRIDELIEEIKTGFRNKKIRDVDERTKIEIRDIMRTRGDIARERLYTGIVSLAEELQDNQTAMLFAKVSLSDYVLSKDTGPELTIDVIRKILDPDFAIQLSNENKVDDVYWAVTRQVAGPAGDEIAKEFIKLLRTTPRLTSTLYADKICEAVALVCSSNSVNEETKITCAEEFSRRKDKSSPEMSSKAAASIKELTS